MLYGFSRMEKVVPTGFFTEFFRDPERFAALRGAMRRPRHAPRRSEEGPRRSGGRNGNQRADHQFFVAGKGRVRHAGGRAARKTRGRPRVRQAAGTRQVRCQARDRLAADKDGRPGNSKESGKNVFPQDVRGIA